MWHEEEIKPASTHYQNINFLLNWICASAITPTIYWAFTMCQQLSRPLCVEFYFKFAQSLATMIAILQKKKKGCPRWCRQWLKSTKVVSGRTKWMNSCTSSRLSLLSYLTILPLQFHPIRKSPKLCQCFLWTLTHSWHWWNVWKILFFLPQRNIFAIEFIFWWTILTTMFVFFPIVLLQYLLNRRGGPFNNI